jgi:hypothetical protein
MPRGFDQFDNIYYFRWISCLCEPMKSIDDLYNQMMLESKYADGGRDAMTGFFLLVIAVVLFLLSIVFTEGFQGSFYFWILFIPSLVFGFAGLLLYFRGKDIMHEAIYKQSLEHPPEKKE